MAATKEQQRRYQAALRRVLAGYRRDDPAGYRLRLDEALVEVDAESSAPLVEEAVDARR